MEKVQTLPVEIQSKILSYLNVEDVLSTGDNDLIVEYISVNKLWNEGTLKLVILHDKQAEKNSVKSLIYDISS